MDDSDSENEDLFDTHKEKENVKVTKSKKVFEPKQKQKQKRTRTEQGQKDMIDRLAKMRVKAFEKRMENKKNREMKQNEENEKIEKVNNYLKNDDLFEKKYADKFEKLTDMITNVSSDINDIKAMKKQKQLQKDEALKNKKQEDIEARVTDTRVANTDTPTVQEHKPLTVNDIISLPNYRKMNFGNKKRF